MWIRVYFIVVLFLSPIAVVNSQDSKYSIEYLTIDQGLPQNQVTSIIQDKKGFMWFGTRGGLARYDGYSMKVFQGEPGNMNTLSNIETLFESVDGKIWIGTKSGGLNCFDPVHETFTQYQFRADDPESISSDAVTAIAETQDGIIWVGTNGNGLNRLDRATGKFHRLLEGRIIVNLACSGDGTLWIPSKADLFKIDKGSDIPVNVGLGLSPDVTLTSAIPDEENGLLFVTGWETGLIIYDVRAKKIIRHEYDLTNSTESKRLNDIYSLFWDKHEKKLWMGYWGEGLKSFHFNQNIQRVFIAPRSGGKYNTDYDIVLKIFGDRSGNIWIGTDGGGVCKLSKRKSFFKSYTFENSGLSSGHVSSMVEDKKGRIWVGTKGGGLNELQGEKVIHHTEVFENIRNSKVNDVHTIYEDFNGDIWFGSNFGLHRIKDVVGNKISFETFTHNASKNSLSDEKVTAICRDHRGRLWVGTQRYGLNRLIGHDESGLPLFKTYSSDLKNPFSLASDRISVLFEDSKERLWIGTHKGLHLYKEDIDGFIKLYHQAGSNEGLSNDIITCIAEDQEGNIWIGTPAGLNKITFQNEVLKAQYFTRKDGLPNDYINSILMDDTGEFWIGSNGWSF
jgi:ligand-binding sensor domain-containing protein